MVFGNVHHFCLSDGDCSGKRVCVDRQCVYPSMFGPCKVPKNGHSDSCFSDYYSCDPEIGRCFPNFLLSDGKTCLAFDFECPSSHFCDLLDGACVLKPGAFETCDPDIGCQRPFECSSWTGQCVPPCSCQEDCQKYGSNVSFPLTCHSDYGQLRYYGFCEDGRTNFTGNNDDYGEGDGPWGMQILSSISSVFSFGEDADGRGFVSDKRKDGDAGGCELSNAGMASYHLVAVVISLLVCLYLYTRYFKKKLLFKPKRLPHEYLISKSQGAAATSGGKNYAHSGSNARSINVDLNPNSNRLYDDEDSEIDSERTPLWGARSHCA